MLMRVDSRPKPLELNQPGGGGTPYNALYGDAPPERGTFFRFQVCKRVGRESEVYKRVGISQAEVYKRVGKSVI